MDVKVKFGSESIFNEVRCTICVRQGDIFGPVLFTISMAGAMITWRENSERPAMVFYNKTDSILIGRRITTKDDKYKLNDL